MITNGTNDLKDILRGDLVDFLVFFLFKKYLSSFETAFIPLIAEAVAESWRARIMNSAALLNDPDYLAIMKEIAGGDIKFNGPEKETEKILKGEIESLCRLLYNIGSDSLQERRMIEKTVKITPETPKAKKPKSKKSNEKN